MITESFEVTPKPLDLTITWCVWHGRLHVPMKLDGVKFQTHMLLKHDLGSTFIELLSYYSEGFNQAMHIESYNYP